MTPGASLGVLLTRTITVAAVLIALWFAWHGVYLFAGAFALLLVGYTYLAWYGGEPIEKRYVRR